MAKVTLPFLTVEAPPPVIAFGIVVAVVGLTAKAYFRTQRYKMYVDNFKPRPADVIPIRDTTDYANEPA